MLLAKQSPDFILEVAERLEPEVRQAFLRAVEALKKAVPVNQIADLLDAGKLTEALSSLSDVPLPDLSEIRDAIASAAIRTSESIAVDFGMSFELVNERAVRWAQNHAGSLITNVNRETMTAVRDIVVRGQREGLNVRNQAQLIRSIVGLTDRDARAVDRFYTGLLEDVSERQARRQRDIMANRLLRRRAENIARTETIRASNMGTQLGWEAAQDQGFLPQSSQKVWIATEDSRTCPICAVLDGQVIGMRDGFNVDRQAVSFTRDGDDFRVAETVPLKRPSIERTPPAHPSCRCTTGLVFGEAPPVVAEPTLQPSAFDSDLSFDEFVEAFRPEGRFDAERFERAKGLLDQSDEGKHLFEFIDKWQGAETSGRFRNQFEKFLAGELDGPAAKRAAAVKRAMDRMPVHDVPLHRGMTVRGQIDNVLAKYKEGSEFDLSLSSFTSDRGTATRYARQRTQNTAGKGTKVVVEWVGDKRGALPIENLARDKFHHGQHEYIGAGRFRILEVKKASGGINIRIEQIEPLG